MKIFVTRAIPKKGLDLLEQYHEIEVNPHNRVLTKEEIIEGMKGKNGLLCLLTDTIDKEIIESEPKLKMIANYAVGYNNIDVSTATKNQIPVSNTPGVLTDATAEMAWALLLSVSRRIVESDTFTREGNFKGWDPMLLHGLEVQGKTLGIIGAGRIGTAVGLKSQGFQMNVLYTDHQVNKTLEEIVQAKKVTFDELLQTSDFISVHVPLIDETYHLISEKELQRMKSTAVLINTSRGPVIDEEALIQALKQQWIFGAGLDVYEHEPQVHPGLLPLKNVVLQPHSASATTESRTNMATMAAENMLAGLQGNIPPNCINPELFNK
jgi:glyoxylate reductase